MAVNQLFTTPPQFVDANGGPYAGALLFFYAAGSSTKQNTYTDSGGGTACDNPITINASGYPEVSGTVVNPFGTLGQTYKIGLAIPGSSDPPASFIWSVDDISPANDISVSFNEWIVGPAPTFVNSTQFTLVGDQTSTFHVGRRVKCLVTAGTVYGYISVTAFTSLTTVTVVIDSGSLDSGLSAVSYGLLSEVNPSYPGPSKLGLNIFSGPNIFATTIGVGGATPAASGAGITFPATQSASSNANTLDDYEEGAFSVTLKGSITDPTSYTANAFDGTYIKIGSVVLYRLHVAFSSISGGLGSIRIAGFPFVAGTSFYPAALGFTNIGNPSVGITPTRAMVGPSTDYLLLWTSSNDASTRAPHGTEVALADVGGSFEIYVSGHYYV